MKRILVAAFVLTMVLFAAVAQAGVQDFTLVNNTGYDIHYVYVSSTQSQSWEEDVLGSSILYNGTSVNITFNAPADQCTWDLKVIDQDSDAFEFYNINLCSVSIVTLVLENGTYKAYYQ